MALLPYPCCHGPVPQVNTYSIPSEPAEDLDDDLPRIGFDDPVGTIPLPPSEGPLASDWPAKRIGRKGDLPADPEVESRPDLP